MSNISKFREIAVNFKALQGEVDKLINQSPLKMEYFTDQLGISRATFYNKRKNGNFEASEIIKIMDLLSGVDKNVA